MYLGQLYANLLFEFHVIAKLKTFIETKKKEYRKNFQEAIWMSNARQQRETWWKIKKLLKLWVAVLLRSGRKIEF